MLDFWADLEGEDPAFENVPSLEVLARMRQELLQGDRRPLYLAWLLCAANDEQLRGAVAPEVPAGLDELSRSQQAFARLFQVDQALLREAAGKAPSQDRSRKAQARKPFEGEWRIESAEGFSRDDLDLTGPASIRFEKIAVRSTSSLSKGDGLPLRAS